MSDEMKAVLQEIRASVDKLEALVEQISALTTPQQRETRPSRFGFEFPWSDPAKFNGWPK